MVPDAALGTAAVDAAALDTAARVRAGHAEVLARVELGQPPDRRTMRRLVALAGRAGRPELAVPLRLTWAWIELDRGRPAACLRQLDLVAPELTGVDVARARCVRGLHACASGRHAESLADLTAAIDQLSRQEDRHWLANALVGRGTARAYLLRARDADADYAAAAALFAQLGECQRTAACVHNRGFVAARSGDLPLALRRFAEADRLGLCVRRHPETLIDRAQALLSAGLPGPAREVLCRAAGLLDAAGRDTKLAEATLAVAQSAGQAGDLALAAATAARAGEMFRRQRRPAWRAAADALVLASRLAAGDQEISFARVSHAVRAAQRHHWWLLAAQLRLAAAGTLPAGRAGRLLTPLARARVAGPAPLRAFGWLAKARLAATDGDRRAVLAACRAGLRVVDRYAEGMAAWELQAGARGLAGDLAQAGLDAALAGGRPYSILRWTDRHRAAVLSRPALRPPADPELAERLFTLRAMVSTCGSRPSTREQRRIAALEDEVRKLDWCRRGQPTPERSWHREELCATVGHRALLNYFCHRENLFAVSLVDGRFHLHRLGRVRRIGAVVRSLRLALAVSAEDVVTSTARELDELLFARMPWLAGDRPLVILPTGVLHALPWATLPSCLGRAVSVAPSVTSWLRAMRESVDDGGERSRGRVWIAGPGLRHAEREVHALHARHGGRLLTGAAAAVDQVMSAVDGADTVHIAAHGRFREDQPLFSALRLADGPLFGHDVPRLTRAPRRIVLSACDSGLSAVRPGDEVMGIAAALLRRGTSTVIASVLPVPDDRAVGLVTALHAGLAAGGDPAIALAEAAAEHGHLGFICLGAG